MHKFISLPSLNKVVNQKVSCNALRVHIRIGGHFMNRSTGG